MSYDICIIGGGPGGYSAAIRGAQLGGRVALVEKGFLGGTCLNYGCIPTKNLYSMSETLRTFGEADKFGIAAKGYSFDFSKAIESKNEVVEHLRNGIHKLFKEHRIDLISGRGAIKGEGKVRVETPAGVNIVEAKNIIIATGSEAADIPQMRIDGRNVMGNREILNLTARPDTLLIVGGGAIGCEFANIFSMLGTKVTIVEKLGMILPLCEREISRIIRRRFEERGVEVITGESVVSSEAGGAGVEATISGGRKLRADKALMAVGRRLNITDLGLEDARFKMAGGKVSVNERMETSVKGFYAVGDIAGEMQLAHVAAREGKIAAANAMSGDVSMDYSAVPSVVYVHPEIASVGKGEADLKSAGIQYHTGRFPYLANGKALAMREEDGFVKVLVSKENGKVLGVHILGTHASDLIAEATLALKMGCTVRDIEDTIHAHPTLSEAFQEACEDTEGMAIHKAGRRGV